MTNPTADAAKLLQKHIAHVIADSDGTDFLSRAKTIMNMIENACPQPAPPEGEPVVWAVKDFADGWIIYAHEAHARRQAELTGARIERLGLAARPKVEDAEVKAHCEHLRASDNPALHQASDLLERIAGERDQYSRLFSSEHERRTDAEAELAERYAELAKAYEVIAHTLTPTDCFCGDVEVVTAAHASHTTRQQQKAKEKL